MALKAVKKSGFVYKPRTTDQVKNRANRKVGNFDSIFKQGYDTYTPHQGDNLIRYLPPTWDDSEHYGYTIFVHNNIGSDNSTYLCPRKMLNKPCPICEASKEAKDAGENDEAKALGTSERIVSWIVDRDADDPEKPHIYNQSWTQDRDVTALCINERTGEILMIDHPDKGYDVSFKRTGTGLKTKYYGWQIDRSDSPINESEKVQDGILEYVRDNPIPDVLNFYDYDYLKGVLTGAVSKKEQGEDEGDEEAPPSKTGKRAVQHDPDDEEIHEVPVSRKRLSTEEEAPFDGGRRRGPRRDQELDEGETDEEAPPPRSARNRKPVEEEEENDRPAPRSSRRAQVDEEVDEEAEEPAPRSRTESRSRRVVAEEEEEQEEETPRARRSSTRVR